MKSMDNAVFLPVLTHLVTASDRENVLSLLSSCMEKIPSKKEILAAVGDTEPKLLHGLLDFFSGHPSAQDIQDGIEHLEHMPVVRLTLAFLPSEGALVRWKHTISDEIGEPCVLDITKDEDVVAGAIIDMKGRLFRSVLVDEME